MRTRNSNQKICPWRITQVLRKDMLYPSYKVRTHEIYRIDYRTLQGIHPTKFVNFNRWEKNLVIRKTHHATEERLKPYVNKLVHHQEMKSCDHNSGDGHDNLKQKMEVCSDNIIGNHEQSNVDVSSEDAIHWRHVEVTPEEFDFINTVSLETFIHNWEAKLVEIGFNKYGEICKAAYVLHLPSKRVLFFCVGMDNGLKTLYVTPEFKHRDSYHGSIYIDANHAMQL